MDDVVVQRRCRDCHDVVDAFWSIKSDKELGASNIQ